MVNAFEGRSLRAAKRIKRHTHLATFVYYVVTGCTGHDIVSWLLTAVTT